MPHMQLLAASAPPSDLPSQQRSSTARLPALGYTTPPPRYFENKPPGRALQHTQCILIVKEPLHTRSQRAEPTAQLCL